MRLGDVVNLLDTAHNLQTDLRFELRTVHFRFFDSVISRHPPLRAIA